MSTDNFNPVQVHQFKTAKSLLMLMPVVDRILYAADLARMMSLQVMLESSPSIKIEYYKNGETIRELSGQDAETLYYKTLALANEQGLDHGTVIIAFVMFSFVDAVIEANGELDKIQETLAA